MDVLTNKSYKGYDYLSRYASFPYYYHTIDKKYIYGITSQLSADNTYTIHKVKNNETWDSLALDYYNNPTFCWCLLDFNRVQDPYTKLNVGDEVKIPALNTTSFEEN